MNIRLKNSFKKDLERMRKRGKETRKVFEIVTLIITGKLEPKHKDHPLVGNWKGWRDCHIEPDWLLIYQIRDDELWLAQTGFHSDLFD